MKRLITLAVVALVSFNFVSCRQDEESADFANNTVSEKPVYRQANTGKTDSVQLKARPVDPDPPVRDGTSW